MRAGFLGRDVVSRRGHDVAIQRGISDARCSVGCRVAIIGRRRRPRPLFGRRPSESRLAPTNAPRQI